MRHPFAARTPLRLEEPSPVAADDPAAEHTLFLSYRPLLLGTLAPYRAEPELYEELITESYVQFCRLLRQFDPRRGLPLPAYLERMLPPAIWSVARRWRRVRRRELTGFAPHSSGPKVDEPGRGAAPESYPPPTFPAESRERPN